MKRSWFGFFLLLALLTAALLCSQAMVRIHGENAALLEKAAGLAMEGDWAGAAFLTAQARGIWDKWTLLRTALADHNPVEEIDGLFAALEVYGRAREKVAFAAACRETAKKIQAMGDAHSLKPENLL